MDNGTMLDLALVAVLAIGAFAGAKRGLWRSLAGAVLLIVAILGSVFLTNRLTDPMTELVYPMVEEKAIEWATNAAQAVVSEQPDDSSGMGNLDDLNGIDLNEVDLSAIDFGALSETLEKFGVSQEKLEELTDSLGDTVSSAVSDTVADLVGDAAKLFVRAVVQTVLYFLCFLLLLVLLKLLVRAIDLVLKLPVLSTANALGGAVFGLVSAALILLLVLSVCNRFGVALPESEETVLFRWFSSSAPSSLLTSLL